MSQARAKELANILRQASEEYYAHGSPTLSDAEFDALKRELESIDPDHPFLQEVGAPTSSQLAKVQHVIPMGSINNVMSLSEYESWLRNKLSTDTQVAVQWKYDGLSVEMIYKNGKFVQAVTRGDGKIGEDVTHTIRNASGFPKVLSSPLNLSVRCEALLPIDTWKRNFKDEMANPRNAAAGLVRRTSSIGSSHLVCIAFDVINGQQWSQERQKIEWLSSMGFEVAITHVMRGNQLPAHAEEMEKKRDGFAFLVDGLVVKANDISVQDRLGEHHGRPYWARAWKFKAAGAHSTISDVEWSIGTQHTLTPVALIKPVKIAGVTVRRVTLHNLDEINRLGVRIGDEVEVIRSGDVIPKIVRVVTSRNGSQIRASRCPVCQSSVTETGPSLKCTNNGCKGVQKERIKAWIQKVGIMYLGGATVDLLFDAGVLCRIRDLYTMTKPAMVQAGVGDGMSDKILVQIERSRHITVANFMGSFSIDLLGRSQAKTLVAAGIDSVDKFLGLTPKQLEVIPGFGKTKANRICGGIKSAARVIDLTAKHMRFAKMTVGKCVGKSFCFTGSASRSRHELQSMAEGAGGEVRHSVGKSLTYLVTSDTTSDSIKSNKAKRFGITILDEEQFVEMVS
jgi:DNA ligase (NAD+)